MHSQTENEGESSPEHEPTGADSGASETTGETVTVTLSEAGLDETSKTPETVTQVTEAEDNQQDSSFPNQHLLYPVNQKICGFKGPENYVSNIIYFCL